MTSVRYVDFDRPALSGVKEKVRPHQTSQQNSMEVEPPIHA